VSYKAGTILTRKTPFAVPEEDSDAPDLTAYNEVEVIGPSPVSTAVRETEWVGQAGTNLSIKPTSFGAVIDRPFGELQRDYDVKSIPPPPAIDRQVIERPEPGLSPEEQFAALEGPTPEVEPTPVDPNAPSPEEVFAAASGSTATASMDTSVQRPEGV
jgi:hypothetical protein